MSNVQSYLQHLVGSIGPRPASSDTERAAAEWIHSMFGAHGLASDIQDFEGPRSRFMADGVVFAVLALAILLAGWVSAVWLTWTLWVLLALCAVCVYLDSRDKHCLSVLMPKGPSQNVVARYAPHPKAGERRRKVVIVAHYDTAVPSLLDTPATAEIYALIRRAGRYVAYAAPVVALTYVLPFAFLDVAHKWVWYVTLVAALVPLALAINSFGSLLIKKFSPGANSNASGVAAMLGVLDELVGEAKGSGMSGETSRIPRIDDAFTPPAGFGGQTSSFAPLSHDAAAGAASSAGLPDDFAWAPSLTGEGFGDADDLDLAPAPAQSTESPSGQTGHEDEPAWGETYTGSAGVSSRASYVPAPSSESDTSEPPTQRSSRGDTRANLFATVEFAEIPEASQETVSFAAVPGAAGRVAAGFADEDVLGPDVIGVGAPAPMVQPMDFGDRKGRRSLFDFLRRDNAAPKTGRSDKSKKPLPAWYTESEPVAEPAEEWLGLSADFDATPQGEQIGTWENFASDDESGWKGGWAEGDLIEDDHYAEEEAARIRRRVAESATVSLDDKEVWFVATGAGTQGQAGMKALLAEYGDDLRGASFINIDTVGEGQLFWLAFEGTHADAKASARLVSVVKRATRDTGILTKAARIHGLSTDATVALRARAKALTLTRLVEGKRPSAAGTVADTVGGVDESLVAEVATFVAEVVRQS